MALRFDDDEICQPLLKMPLRTITKSLFAIGTVVRSFRWICFAVAGSVEINGSKNDGR